MNSFEALKQAVNKAGAKAVASELGLSMSMLYKWTEPSAPGDSGTLNPLDRIAGICRLANDTSPLDWLCRQMDGFFVKNAPPRRLDPPQVLHETHNVLRQFSSVLEAVSRGFGDGTLTQDEATEIRREWESLKSLGESFVGACEAQVAPGPAGKRRNPRA